jgi:hypothetical protein
LIFLERSKLERKWNLLNINIINYIIFLMYSILNTPGRKYKFVKTLPGPPHLHWTKSWWHPCPL